MELRKISERIFYLPASDNPLSADVSIIHGDKAEWIFDVGNCVEAQELIESIKRDKNVVLSHFHEDHSGNLSKITYSSLFLGDFAKKKFKVGTEITSPKIFDDGVKITLFPLPSLHSKGAVGLEVDNEFAFLGDSTYGCPKKGNVIYNVNYVKEMIDVLEKLKADKFLLSHHEKFMLPKEKVISGLKKLYEKRLPGEAYLPL